jgi:ABC-type ATPase with predicted acetyltransferase domain
MLTHIVIWKYRRDVEDTARQEHVDQLRSLDKLLPGIISLNVGKDILKLARSFDTGLVILFKDRETLDAYTVHPDHQAVVEFGKSISETVASVDFES